MLLAAALLVWSGCTAQAGSLSVAGLGGGGGGSGVGRTNVCDVTVGAGGAADIDCDPITAADGHTLYISALLRSEQTGAADDGTTVEISNDSTTANYMQAYRRTGSVWSGAGANPSRTVFSAPNADGAAGLFTNGFCQIPNFSSTTQEKHLLCTYSHENTSQYFMWDVLVIWESTAAVTAVRWETVSGSDFEVGSRVQVWTGP